jgi:hypothetical protein
METYFEISESEKFVKVEVLEFINYDSDSDWDKNWLKSRVTVAVGAFHGEYLADFQTIDFERFKIGLHKLYDNLAGAVMFDPLEGHLLIKIIGDGIGHFNVDVEASDKPNYGGELSFSIDIDQTYIMPIVKQLSAITNEFPIIGGLWK